jgi:hypothetical protein
MKGEEGGASKEGGGKWGGGAEDQCVVRSGGSLDVGFRATPLSTPFVTCLTLCMPLIQTINTHISAGPKLPVLRATSAPSTWAAAA